MEVRRVVTGHDASGKSIISTDEVLKPVSRGAGAGVVGCEIWSTDRMPIDNSREAEESQRAGFVKHDRPHMNFVDTGAGLCMRVIEWGPGNPPFTHRTETMDLVVILSGEIDLECEGDEVAHLKAGDVVVQRGGLHTWMNRGSVPCLMAGILIDAEPVTVNGEEKKTHFPD